MTAQCTYTKSISSLHYRIHCQQIPVTRDKNAFREAQKLNQVYLNSTDYVQSQLLRLITVFLRPLQNGCDPWKQIVPHSNSHQYTGTLRPLNTWKKLWDAVKQSGIQTSEWKRNYNLSPPLPLNTGILLRIKGKQNMVVARLVINFTQDGVGELGCRPSTSLKTWHQWVTSTSVVWSSWEGRSGAASLHPLYPKHGSLLSQYLAK